MDVRSVEAIVKALNDAKTLTLRMRASREQAMRLREGPAGAGA